MGDGNTADRSEADEEKARQWKPSPDPLLVEADEIGHGDDKQAQRVAIDEGLVPIDGRGAIAEDDCGTPDEKKRIRDRKWNKKKIEIIPRNTTGRVSMADIRRERISEMIKPAKPPNMANVSSARTQVWKKMGADPCDRA